MKQAATTEIGYVKGRDGADGENHIKGLIPSNHALIERLIKQ